MVCKYLLKEEGRKDAEDIYGRLGPKYLEQIRSFPNSSMSDFFVTTREKVRAGGGYDEFVWEGTAHQTCAFCDPGFGGDPCRIGAFRFGNARIQTIDGAYHTGPIFEPVAPLETIMIDTTKVADDEWRARVQAITGSNLIIRHGAPVTPEQQIVVGVYEFLQRHGIPYHHFGYDGSMRASIVHEMVAILGSSVMSIDFGGRPTERTIDTKGTTAQDAYYNFVTEMYFNFADVIQSGQLRGGDKIPAAIAQIVRRPWAFVGTKKQIQPKKDYKEANQGRSPDDADTVCGGLEVAMRLGFRSFARRRVDDDSSDAYRMARALSEMPAFSRPTAKKLLS